MPGILTAVCDNFFSYMFWTDWMNDAPTIYRACLDGSNPKVLFTAPTVTWPNGITVDFIAERIYWVDAKEDYIASSDFFGKGFKKVIEQDVGFSILPKRFKSVAAETI